MYNLIRIQKTYSSQHSSQVICLPMANIYLPMRGTWRACEWQLFEKLNRGMERWNRERQEGRNEVVCEREDGRPKVSADPFHLLLHLNAGCWHCLCGILTFSNFTDWIIGFTVDWHISIMKDKPNRQLHLPPKTNFGSTISKMRIDGRTEQRFDTCHSNPVEFAEWHGCACIFGVDKHRHDRYHHQLIKQIQFNYYIRIHLMDVISNN